MRARKLVAISALIAGLTGAAVIATDVATVVGSSGDAGVMTICTPSMKVCNPGGPIIVRQPISIGG